MYSLREIVELNKEKEKNMWDRIKIWLASSVVSKYAIRISASVGAFVITYLVGLGVAPETAKGFGDNLAKVLEALVQVAIVAIGTQG